MGNGRPPHRGPNIGELLDKIACSCLMHPAARKISDGRSTGVLSFSDDDDDDQENSDFASANNERSPNRSDELFPLDSGQYEKLLQRMHAMEELVREIFDTTYALKTAYIRLQIAHSPYDPDKLRLADKDVIAEIRKLSDLKQCYRRIDGLSHAVPLGKIAETEDQKKIVAAYENVVKELKTEVKEKNTEIYFLKHNLKEATKSKERLERRLKKHASNAKDHNAGGPGAVIQRRISLESPTPELFQSTLHQVVEAAKNFTKLLMSRMKNAKWDVDAAAASIAPTVTFTKQNHRSFAFESYLCERMFEGFENESFYISGSLSSLLEPDKHRHDCFTHFRDMLPMHPAELLNIFPDSALGKFCNKKYLRIVHPKMEEAFFGNFEQRGHVVNGKHPSSEFYQSFIKVAKAVWILHKLAFSFNPVPSHFHVKPNTVFQSTYMESVVPVPMQESEQVQGGVQLAAFAITPGFKFVRGMIIKSRVYVVNKLGKNPAQ